jgi:hypothetical protein
MIASSARREASQSLNAVGHVFAPRALSVGAARHRGLRKRDAELTSSRDEVIDGLPKD